MEAGASSAAFDDRAVRDRGAGLPWRDLDPRSRTRHDCRFVDAENADISTNSNSESKRVRRKSHAIFGRTPTKRISESGLIRHIALCRRAKQPRAAASTSRTSLRSTVTHPHVVAGSNRARSASLWKKSKSPRKTIRWSRSRSASEPMQDAFLRRSRRILTS